MAGKGGEMSFKDTPLTRLAGTALERIAPDPAPTVDAIARYGETDLLCYRAETPRKLVHRQHQQWQPWLDWAALTYDAPLRVVTGVGYVKQHHDIRRGAAAGGGRAGRGRARRPRHRGAGAGQPGARSGPRGGGTGRPTPLTRWAPWTNCSRRSNGERMTKRSTGAPACWRTSCWRHAIST